MDSGDPALTLFRKILSLEPDYGSKINGYLLLQDLGERELLRLARGPESVLKSFVLKVKSQLGISSNNLSSSSSTLTSPFPLNPTCRPPINGRLGSNCNGSMDFSRYSPSYPSSSSTTPWSLNNIVNPSNGNNPHIPPKHTPVSKQNNGVSVMDSGADAGGSADLLDHQFLRDRLSFLDDSCFSGETEDVVDPRIPLDYSVDNGETHLYRSFSADAPFGSGGAVCKPHIMQQHAQRDGGQPFCCESYLRSLERFEKMISKLFDRQPCLKIYLTFPADSTFNVEDVATYFSHFGTVQDVWLPYRQNCTYGFVSFDHPETVKALLARGNPHFIGDSRVLVKPYKLKRELSAMKQQQLLEQQIEREYFSPCSIPSGIDPRKSSDFHLCSKMYGRSEMMRRKMEQADFVRAIEFERRHITNLQLPNSITPNHHHSFSVGSPGYNSSASNQNPEYQFEHTGIDALEVDHASELYPYSVINRMSVNNNYSNGAEEGTDKSEMIRRKMEQAIEIERRRFTNLQLPNSTTPNHHRNFSVGSPGYFSSASNQSHDYQFAHTDADALEVVDDASELHPYPVINRMRVNNNYSHGAEEGTDTGSPLELALPSNLFPSASSTNDHNTDDSAKTNTKVGASSTNGNDHKPSVTTNNFMQ